MRHNQIPLFTHTHANLVACLITVGCAKTAAVADCGKGKNCEQIILVNYFDNRYIHRLAITAKSEKGTACCYAVIVLLFLRLAHAVVRRHVKLAAW
jgi:hypothetical protein